MGIRWNKQGITWENLFLRSEAPIAYGHAYLDWEPLYLVPSVSPGVCPRLSYSVTPVSCCRQIDPKVCICRNFRFLVVEQKESK